MHSTIPSLTPLDSILLVIFLYYGLEITASSRTLGVELSYWSTLVRYKWRLVSVFVKNIDNVIELFIHF